MHVARRRLAIRRNIVLSLALLAAGACADTEPSAPSGPLGFVATAPIVAFIGVTVVPMDSERVLPDQIVVIDNGRITTIGSSGQVDVPAGATRIDGRGRFLTPGLADMHVHLGDADIEAYVSAGITTVRNMWGVPGMLEFAAQSRGPLSTADDGTRASPAVYSASPGIDGSPPTWGYTREISNPADAEALVAEMASEGWSFLKLYNRLSPEVYDALADAAALHGIRFLRHVPWAVTLEHALDRGHASIEHLTGYDRALGPGSAATFVDAGRRWWSRSPGGAYRSGGDVELPDAGGHQRDRQARVDPGRVRAEPCHPARDGQGSARRGCAAAGRHGRRHQQR